MTFDKTGDGGTLTLTLDKKLSAVTAQELEKTLQTELKGVKNFIVDMKKLAYVSSSGLRVLLKAQRLMNTQGQMEIRNSGPEIMNIFRTTGFDEILTLK